MFAVLACFVAGSALPVSALDVDFSGEFYVEGILNSNENMLDSDHTSDFRQMRLRVKTDFKISDELELTTRFDALEKLLGKDDSAFNNNLDEENIDFDRAFITYKSPIGLFQVGRMTGGVWGTSFYDDEIDADRIKYVLPLPIGDNKLYLIAIAEKATEVDKGTALSDEDNDKYYLCGVYRTPDYEVGMLTGYYAYRSAYDPAQVIAMNAFGSAYSSELSNNPGNTIYTYMAQYLTGLATDPASTYNSSLGAPAALGGNAADPMNTMFTRGVKTSGDLFAFIPYFKGKFGNIGVEAEIAYITGTLEYDDSPFNVYGLPKNPDRDVRAYAYMFEGKYDMGPFTFQAGYATYSGDADYENTSDPNYGKDDLTAAGYLQPGLEWEKLFILGSDTHGMNTTIGNGVGNWVGDGMMTASTAMMDGYQLIYAGVDYALNDSMTLGLVAGYSKADDIPDNEEISAGVYEDYDDDQGFEYDISFTWKITENLQYKALVAYLDGGEYWESRATGVKDPSIDTSVYCLYHQIKLEF